MLYQKNLHHIKPSLNLFIYHILIYAVQFKIAFNIFLFTFLSINLLLKLKNFSIFLKSNCDTSGHMRRFYIFVEIYLKVYRCIQTQERF